MSTFLKKILFVLLMLLGGASVIYAQQAAGSASSPAGCLSAAESGADSEQESEMQPEVQLITVSPGSEIYALDGHTALRFVGPDGNPDYTVNWGVFDFSAPNFLYRFVKGETDYMAWGFPTDMFLEEYRADGRTVTAQTLNLTPEETRQLQTLVAINLLPQNRTYRYNYIYDNCATRPLELIEKAVGQPIRIADVKGFTYGETGIIDTDSTHTFRSEMTRSHADYPWYQFGIDLALGNGLDKEITDRERTYSPLFLHDALTNSVIINPDGTIRPLVKSEEVLLSGGRVTEQPTPFWLSPRFVAFVVFLLTMLITLRDLRRRRISRWYDSLFYSLLFIDSLLMTFLIFISVHEATSPNWLFLSINPFTFIPAVLIWIKSCKRVVYCYQICNFAALFLLLIIGASGLQAINKAFYMLIATDMLLSIKYIIVYHTASK